MPRRSPSPTIMSRRAASTASSPARRRSSASPRSKAVSTRFEGVSMERLWAKSIAMFDVFYGLVEAALPRARMHQPARPGAARQPHLLPPSARLRALPGADRRRRDRRFPRARRDPLRPDPALSRLRGHLARRRPAWPRSSTAAAGAIPVSRFGARSPETQSCAGTRIARPDPLAYSARLRPARALPADAAFGARLFKPGDQVPCPAAA